MLRLARRASNRHLAAQASGQCLHNVKAEAGPGGLGISSDKGRENVDAVRQAGTFVCNRDHHPSAGAMGAQALRCRPWANT